MGSRAPAGGDEQLLGLDRSSVAEDDTDDSAGPLDLLGANSEPDVDARLLHRVGELLAGEWLLLAE